ncbi:SHOCT domain-containing protein [Natrialba chahannaoensis]|uniref:SHOCT domain-containing protein n=1 Tax=Natrialba chahannaoensis TaxID=68911 RepID=UPI0012689CF3|nr:SHOCT domain-containing protein [Natrialba chahannaoensis]
MYGEPSRTVRREDLWLLVAIVTFGIISILSLIELEFVVDVLAVIGWFVLTPVFLFWGEDIAALMAERRQPTGSTWPESSAGDTSDQTDAFAQLKHRYASGELSEEEFEHRRDRLLEADEAFDREAANRPMAERGGRAQSANGRGDRGRELE